MAIEDGNSGKFLIELVSVFNPKGFDEAGKKVAEAKTWQSSLSKTPAAPQASPLAATAAQAERTNRGLIASVRRDWQTLNSSAVGGFRQAMIEIEQLGVNWTKNWIALVASASARTASSMRDFFDGTKEGFLDLEKLIKNVFNNILDAFFDMISQMAAKAAILGIFKGMGLFEGNVLQTSFGTVLGGFAEGGAVAKTGLYNLHAGEYVLPPDVVGAIKAERTPSPQAATARQSGGSPVDITVSPTINFSGGAASQAELREIAEQLTEATRRGVSWAVEQAKVSYKIGRSRSAECAL